ncbi:ABC transporter permease [Nocardioides gilvus]|uniref:ABC transporter permease n=1 Tax=Nocardioides gilvus TaxID=1735589 RepID=UPI000D75004D|nr:FtsX-like permease family protein [Nocardioides gilvus]
MRTVLFASLRHHTRRYVASALAVIIGVAFIVATDGLAGALRDGMTADVGKPYAGASYVVETQDLEQVQALVEAGAREGFGVQPIAENWTSLRVEGRTVDNITLGTVALDPDLRWQELVAGQHPTGPGEVVVDERTAARAALDVGDEVVIPFAEKEGAFRVVGISDATVGAGADVYLLWSDIAADQSVWVRGVLWNGTFSAADELTDGAVIWTAEEHVRDLQKQITQGVDVISLMVMLFGAIALGVAILVITNTFAILFAQRTRDFALLRCVGVTQRQLRRSVRIEAMVLAIVAAGVGVLVGMGAAWAFGSVLARRFDAMGQVSFSPAWVIGAAVVGILVTVVAAWLPTRAVTRVSPLAALRPDAGVGISTPAGRFRILLATLMIAGGVAALVAAMANKEATTAILLMLAGGALSFVGVLLLGPLLIPALLRGAGRLISRKGPAGAVARLATGNSVRNPRRTATTAASLMVGVTLTTAVLTGLHVMWAGLSEEMDTSYSLDMAVAVIGAEPLPDDIARRAAELDGVDDAVLVTGGRHELLTGTESVLLGVPDTSILRGSEDVLRGADLVVPHELINVLGEQDLERYYADGTVTVRGVDGPLVVKVRSTDAYGGTVVLDPAVLEKLVSAPEPRALWLRAQDGADAGDLETALNTLLGRSDLVWSGDYEERTWVETQMNVMTGAVVGLLGVAIVIALIGIGNTLGLSVIERGRENALLRAMGLTKPQLRRTLAVEGLLVAMVATLLGIAIGLGFAWVGIEVLVAEMIDTSFAVPVRQLAVVLVVAGVSGVLASVLPSRRAARVSPAEGLALQ